MEPSTQSQSSSSVAIPIAIVIGFALIAAAIYFGGGSQSNDNPTVGFQQNQQGSDPDGIAPSGEIRPVDDTDHIRGNPNAPIMFVEYSDYDCPFCKNFHDTMKRIMDEYGVSGEVGWVYRHFPLQQLHPNAPAISVAAECVHELAGEDGNEAFWEFSDLVFNERGTNEPTNMLELPEYAEQVGVDSVAFQSCVESGRHQERVASDLQDGLDAGVQGTPHTVVLVGGQQAVINGAQPYPIVKGIVEDLIAQTEGRPIGEPETAEEG